MLDHDQLPAATELYLSGIGGHLWTLIRWNVTVMTKQSCWRPRVLADWLDTDSVCENALSTAIQLNTFIHLISGVHSRPTLKVGGRFFKSPEWSLIACVRCGWMTQFLQMTNKSAHFPRITSKIGGLDPLAPFAYATAFDFSFACTCYYLNNSHIFDCPITLKSYLYLVLVKGIVGLVCFSESMVYLSWGRAQFEQFRFSVENKVSKYALWNSAPISVMGFMIWLKI